MQKPEFIFRTKKGIVKVWNTIITVLTKERVLSIKQQQL
jgi:hypothetical protein